MQENSQASHIGLAVPRAAAPFGLAIGLLAATLIPASLLPAQEVSFKQHIWPIFRQQCWSCHSGAKPEGKLLLDTQEHFQKGGERGALVVPGKAEESRLFKMIRSPEPEMPPETPLAKDQQELIRRWIDQGAKIDSYPVDGGLPVAIPATYSFAPAITSVAISPDGKSAAAACRSEVVVVRLDADEAPRRLPTECDLVTHVEFSPDGALLASAGGTPGRFGEVRFFQAIDGKVQSSRRMGFDTLFRGSFAPQGGQLAVGGADGAVYVVPVDPNASLKRFELHSDWVMDVAWTPDGSKLISAGRDKATKVANSAGGELLRTIDTSPERMNAVAADAKFAISTGLSRQLLGFELEIALKNVEITGGGNDARPVSRRDQYLKNLEGPPAEILDLATSGDRKFLAVAGRFGEIRVYALPGLNRTATIAKARAPVYSVSLNQDGTLLAAGSRDGHLEVFKLPGGELVKSIVPVPVK